MPDESVYDDGSEVVHTVEPDDPIPDNYVDPEEVIEEGLQDQVQVAAGEFLGLAIDPDDDEDNGSQWGTAHNPTMSPSDFEELS